MPDDTKTPSIFPKKESDELSKVNKELYERNLEMAIKNHTLLIIRKMYEIMNTTYGVEETAQKLVEAIVKELKVHKIYIFLKDTEKKTIQFTAVYPDEFTKEEYLKYFNMPDYKFSIPLSNTENFCVDCVVNNRTRLTNSAFDVLAPIVDEKTAFEIQTKLKLETSIIYPIIFGNEALGGMIIGMDKHIGNLTMVERDALKEIVDVVAIAIERAQIYRDLQMANEKLEEMDKLKDDFLSIASHELRTPMTAIKSYLWMVLNRYADSLTPKNKEYLDRVYNSTERLINLVNDMLNVSRIESGKILMKMSDFDLVQLIDDVKNEVSARMQERRQELIIECSEKQLMVHGDREKIHQVLENLVGNSIKFTGEGGKITVGTVRKNNMVRVFVLDNGKGIAKDDIPKLFKKFGRLENSLESISQSSGTGLGLYICQQFVELCGGKITVEAEEGKGAKFIFTLPFVLEKFEDKPPELVET